MEGNLSNVLLVKGRCKNKSKSIAQNHDERHRGLICFEEPENGIHPYRMKKILEVLRSLATDFENVSDSELPLRQVFINTHFRISWINEIW